MPESGRNKSNSNTKKSERFYQKKNERTVRLGWGKKTRQIRWILKGNNNNNNRKVIGPNKFETIGQWLAVLKS